MKKTVLIIDPNNPYYNEILTVCYEEVYAHIDAFTSSLVGRWIIEDWGDWFWAEDFIENKTYIDIAKRGKNLLVFM